MPLSSFLTVSLSIVLLVTFRIQRIAYLSLTSTLLPPYLYLLPYSSHLTPIYFAHIPYVPRKNPPFCSFSSYSYFPLRSFSLPVATFFSYSLVLLTLNSYSLFLPSLFLRFLPFSSLLPLVSHYLIGSAFRGSLTVTRIIPLSSLRSSDTLFHSSVALAILFSAHSCAFSHESRAIYYRFISHLLCALALFLLFLVLSHRRRYSSLLSLFRTRISLSSTHSTIA